MRMCDTFFSDLKPANKPIKRSEVPEIILMYFPSLGHSLVHFEWRHLGIDIHRILDKQDIVNCPFKFIFTRNLREIKKNHRLLQ